MVKVEISHLVELKSGWDIGTGTDIHFDDSPNSFNVIVKHSMNIFAAGMNFGLCKVTPKLGSPVLQRNHC